MCVHVLIKDSESNFTLKEAKAFVTPTGFVLPERKTAAAQAEFAFFTGTQSGLYYKNPPEGLLDEQIEGLFAFALETYLGPEKDLFNWPIQPAGKNSPEHKDLVAHVFSQIYRRIN